MASRVCSVLFVAAASCALIAEAGRTRAALPQIPAVLPAGRASVATLPPEVRLRKLHLVRPDLIPYPIAIEVVC